MKGIVLAVAGCCLTAVGCGLAVNSAAVTGDREGPISRPSEPADAVRKAVSSALVEEPTLSDELAMADEPSESAPGERASSSPKAEEPTERSPSDLPLEAVAPETVAPPTSVAAETSRKKCRLRGCRRIASRPRTLRHRTLCHRIRRLR